MANRRETTEEEPSGRREGKRRKLVLDDSSSEQSGDLSHGRLQGGLLKGNDAVHRYAKDFSFREVELGRAVSSTWLNSQESVNVGSWLDAAGWKEFVSVKEDVYPCLVRILYANLDPTSMVSWVGAYKVRLNVEVWNKVFNIPNPSTEDEAPMRSMTKGEIFRELLNEEILGNKTWVSASNLPKDADVRLAMNIIMNVLIPRKRNKDQIKEREGRILHALKNGKMFNLGQEIVNHIRQAFSKNSLPLCFPMHLMRIMKHAKVILEMAGTADIRRFKDSSIIDERTLGRLGFKKDHTRWIFVGRGNVKEKSSLGSHPEAPKEEREEEEDEGGEGHHEEHFGHEESTPPSAMPGPSTSTRHTSLIPSPLAQQLNDLQASIHHLSAHLTEQLAYLSATVHSKLESMDSKLEGITLRLQSCETKLDQLTSESPFPSPTYSPMHSPYSPPYSPPTTPIQISSDSEPTYTPKPEYIPTPSSQPVPLSVIPPLRPRKAATKRSSLQSKKPHSSA